MKNILFFIFLSLGGIVFGEETLSGEKALAITDSAANIGTGAVFTFGDFFRMILVLIFIIAIIYGIFHILKKMNRHTLGIDNNLIDVVSSCNLAPGKAVHVIKVGKHFYVVGSGEHGVSFISEITDEESMTELNSSAFEKITPDNSFIDFARNFFIRKGKEK